MNKYIRQTGWQGPGAEKAECAPGSLVGQSRSKAHLVLGVLPTDLRPLNSFQMDQHCCESWAQGLLWIIRKICSFFKGGREALGRESRRERFWRWRPNVISGEGSTQRVTHQGLAHWSQGLGASLAGLICDPETRISTLSFLQNCTALLKPLDHHFEGYGKHWLYLHFVFHFCSFHVNNFVLSLCYWRGSSWMLTASTVPCWKQA